MTTTSRLIVLLQTLGGCSYTRRAFACLAVILVCASSTALAGGDDPVVRVTDRDGGYQVSTSFTVHHQADLVRAVLTDYARIPDFMPDVKVSRVRERSADRVVVEQEAVAKLLFFSRRIHLVLEILESPGRIEFRDICGKSFVSYLGSWRIEPNGASTKVTYELSARPTAEVPGMIVRRLFSRDVEKTIEQLRREMAARSARTG
jgi:ribosome-associated toxin RatA of RatAB toxin-antitoxin module